MEISNGNNNYIGIIDDKYKIIREICEGGEGIIYLVKDNKTNKIFVAKTPKDGDDLKKERDNNKIIKELNNPNIVEYIESGEDIIEVEDRETKKRDYIIFEYCNKGELYKYLDISKGFKEKVVKIIFKKILETVEEIHKRGIYHFDLKTANILIDNDYNIKIGDFGLSEQRNEKNNGIFIGEKGTLQCMCPQMFLKTKDNKDVPYDGSKADIFSLGVILFNLLTGVDGFWQAKSKDYYYYYIKFDKQKYFEKVEKANPIKNISPEFKKLYLDMVSFEENDRPSIQDILQNDLFNEINNLTEEEKKKIVKEELKDIKFNDEENIIVNSRKIYESFEDEKNFDEKTMIKYITNENLFDNYIKINGKLNPIDFMNEFANGMEDIYDNIELNKKYFKFNIIIRKKETVEEKQNLNKIEKDIKIKVELLKIKDNEFILNFIKGNGALRDYYQYLKEVMKYAKEFILNLK